MKYLHIMPPSQRMMKGYLMMLRKYFNREEHTILFSSQANGVDKGMLLFENTIDFPQLGKGKIKKYLSFNKLFSQAEHIVFHQFIPNLSLLIFLFFHKKYLQKAIWVMWGIDLYNYKYKSKHIKHRILNYIGKVCRQHLGIPVALLPIDIEVYEKEFGKKPVLCAPYGTADDIWKHLDELVQKNLQQEVRQILKERNESDSNIDDEYEEKPPLRILIGHNSHTFNRHAYILNQIERFSVENIEIYLPLSYGNGGTDHINDYPRMVEEYAKILFPNKVKVMKKLISKWDYDVFLSTIDIAILGAPRQNALGNIIRLLYMGKKVYLAPDNPLFYFLKEKGFTIYNIEDLKDISYEAFSLLSKQSEPNPWLKKYFGTDSAAHLWKQVFDYAEGKITFEEINIP